MKGKVKYQLVNRFGGGAIVQILHDNLATRAEALKLMREYKAKSVAWKDMAIRKVVKP